MIHTMRQTSAALVVLLLIGALPLHAQTPRGPVPVRLGLTAANGEVRSANGMIADLRRAVAADSLPETQWVKGGFIGAAILGSMIALLAVELDEYTNPNQGRGFPGPLLGGFMVGGGFGFFIGALIGGQFEK